MTDNLNNLTPGEIFMKIVEIVKNNKGGMEKFEDMCETAILSTIYKNHDLEFEDVECSDDSADFDVDELTQEEIDAIATIL